MRTSSLNLSQGQVNQKSGKDYNKLSYFSATSGGTSSDCCCLPIEFLLITAKVSWNFLTKYLNSGPLENQCAYFTENSLSSFSTKACDSFAAFASPCAG